MDSNEKQDGRTTATASAFSSSDVRSILREKCWLGSEDCESISAWCERAAALLGPQAANAAEFADLLGLVFHYDAAEILGCVESHAVLARRAAREVVRELALELTAGGELDSARFSEIVNRLKERLELRGRDLFHPIRLALAGRAGEGELDRVILLLDTAAALPFAVRVKGARERMLEFCAALD